MSTLPGVYSGQIEKGQMHGKGTLVYPNGKLFCISTWGVHCDAYSSNDETGRSCWLLKILFVEQVKNTRVTGSGEKGMARVA